MTEALGEAVVACWGSLPQEIQHMVFEAVVDKRAEFRDPLALFLHDRNPRTANADSTG